MCRRERPVRLLPIPRSQRRISATRRSSVCLTLRYPSAAMQLIPTEIPEVKLLEPKKFGDHRGFFSEVYSQKALRDLGLDLNFVQDNHSLSAQKGTVRALHYQLAPMAQDKLVRVVHGAILDVAVDIRK